MVDAQLPGPGMTEIHFYPGTAAEPARGGAELSGGAGVWPERPGGARIPLTRST